MKTASKKISLLVFFLCALVFVAIGLPPGTVRSPIYTDGSGNVVSTNIVVSNQWVMVPAPTVSNHLVRLSDLQGATNGLGAQGVTNVFNEPGATSNLISTAAGAKNVKVKGLIPGSGISITDSGTNLTIAATASATGVTNVINEPGATSNLVSSASGAIIAKIKGLLPGANITITDSGTNLTIASTAASGAAAVTNAPNFFVAPFTNTFNGFSFFSNIVMRGILNMGGNRVTNGADATGALDLTTFQQLQGATNVAWNVTQYPLAVTNVDNEVGSGTNIVSSAALARNVKLKKLLPGSGITITDTTTSLTFAATASATGVTNVINEPGANSNLVSSASGAVVATIKGLRPGANITITDTGTNLTIASTAASGAAALTNIGNFFITPYTNVVNGTLQVSNLWALGILNMGGNTITNLANGANALDAVNLGQLQGATNVTFNPTQYPAAVTNVDNEVGTGTNAVSSAALARNVKVKKFLPGTGITITDTTTSLTFTASAIGAAAVTNAENLFIAPFTNTFNGFSFFSNIVMRGILNMGGNRITNGADASAALDFTTFQQLQGATNVVWNMTQYPFAVTNVANEAGATTNLVTTSVNARNVKVKGLLPGANVTLTDNGTNITIAATGASGVTNVTNEAGTGTNLVSSVVAAANVTIKKLLPGANVTLTDTGTNITIASSGSGSPITVTNVIMPGSIGATANAFTNLVVCKTTATTNYCQIDFDALFWMDDTSSPAAVLVRLRSVDDGSSTTNIIFRTYSGAQNAVASGDVPFGHTIFDPSILTTNRTYILDGMVNNGSGDFWTSVKAAFQDSTITATNATQMTVTTFPSLVGTASTGPYAVTNAENFFIAPYSNTFNGFTYASNLNLRGILNMGGNRVTNGANAIGVLDLTTFQQLQGATNVAWNPTQYPLAVTNVVNEPGATSNLVSTAVGSIAVKVKGLLPGSGISITDNGTNLTLASTVSAGAAALTNIGNFFIQPYTNVVNGTLQSSNFWALGILNMGGFTITNLANGANALDAVNLGQLQGATNVAWNTGQYPLAVTNVANEAGATTNLITTSVNARNVKVKGLLPGANITLTDNGTNVTIASTASGGGGNIWSMSNNVFTTGTTNTIPIISADTLLTSNNTSIAQFSPTGAVFNMSVVVTNKVINYSAVVTNVWDCNAAQNAIFTLTNNACLLLSNYWAGGKYSAYILQNSVGNWTMTLVPTNNFKTANGITGLGYTPTTNANARDLLNFDVFTNGDVTWSVFRKIQ